MDPIVDEAISGSNPYGAATIFVLESIIRQYIPSEQAEKSPGRESGHTEKPPRGRCVKKDLWPPCLTCPPSARGIPLMLHGA